MLPGFASGMLLGQSGGGDALDISGTPVLTATKDSAYAGFTVSATGGTPPYAFSIAAGALPDGITLNSSTGAVSGTPTEAGVFSGIVIRVTDDNTSTDDLPAFTLSVAPVALASPPVGAVAASARDVTNGWQLYEKDVDTLRAVASLAKMATALICVREKGGLLSNTVTVAATDDDDGGTNASLLPGDVISYEDLLYGLLLPSGNDAANCIARTIGTDIFNETGTGNTGITRFVEEMNALATELGLANTNFTNAHGLDDTGNGMSARDASILAGHALLDPTIQAISSSASRLITITGANARTYTVNHTSQMVSDDGIAASKSGFDTNAGYCLQVVWEAPNGSNIAITVLGSTLTGDRYIDAQGIIYQLLQDFPYLDDGNVGTDPQIANVVVLSGGDPGFTDESSYARTLTDVGGVTRTTSGPLTGTHSYSFDGTDDRIEAADATELSMGSSEFAIEFDMAGSGSEPAGLTAFVSKWNTTGNQREWSVQYDPGSNNLVLFVSTTGSNFPSATFNLNDITPSVFFNGAKRKILARRDDDLFAVYVNGVRGISLSQSGSLFAGTAKAVIGARASGAGAEFFFAGKLDEVRVTNGHPRQTAARYTPSVKAFPRS